MTNEKLEKAKPNLIRAILDVQADCAISNDMVANAVSAIEKRKRDWKTHNLLLCKLV